MMDGFGLPITAGDFRFRAESRIVRRLLRGIDAESSVLDLGSGIGYWAEEFAHRYSRVIAVEGSNTLYQTLKERCGFTVRHVERNEPYVLMQMGCELIKKWQAFMPSHLQALQIAGPLAYWGMRLGNPWITRLPKALGLSFPVLENHYFVLAADTS